MADLAFSADHRGVSRHGRSQPGQQRATAGHEPRDKAADSPDILAQCDHREHGAQRGSPARRLPASRLALITAAYAATVAANPDSSAPPPVMSLTTRPPTPPTPSRSA